MYQVLARKWRPQTFEQLVGQTHVARTLRNAVSGGRLAHAYIFAGVRGTGKTTVARLLAKCLNCEQGPTPVPCNGCVPCREIAEGRALDVLEMDAASRTGVDDIRELQEVLAYPPVRDRYKVLIVDEAHMLSKAAFNALLKTLEEPPPRVVFVLATTEIQKVLPTIVSRCQVHEFRRVPVRDVAAHLRAVCDEESVRISDGTLERVARAGEGSVRDALTALERLLAFCGQEVGDDDALRILGAVRTEILVAWVEALAARDAARLLAVLDGVVEEGHDLVHFWGELVALLRDLLVAASTGDPGAGGRPADEMARLREAAAGLTREDLGRAFQAVADLEPGLKASSQPRFLFEAALIRLADLGAVRPIEELLSGLRETPPLAPAPEKKKGPEAAGGTTGLRTPDLGAVSAAAGADPRVGSVDRTHGTAFPRRASSDGGAELGDVGAFRAAVHEARPMLDAMLDQAAAIAWEPGALRIAFGPSAPEALRRQLERPETMAVLVSCASRAAGSSVEVRLAFDAAGPKPTPGRPETPPPAPGSPGPAVPPRREGDPPADPAAAEVRHVLLARIRSEPAVAALLHEFGAQVVDVRTLSAVEGVPPPPAPPGHHEEYA